VGAGRVLCRMTETSPRLTREQRLAAIIERELGTESPKTQAWADEAQNNIIHQIMSSDLPAEEKAPWRVARECASVVLAGTETTGGLLSSTTYHLLANPAKLARLRDELLEVEVQLGRTPSYLELKGLPYLVRRLSAPNGLGALHTRQSMLTHASLDSQQCSPKACGQ
jgi:cytochrome P450